MEGKNRWKDGKEKKITILEITVWNSSPLSRIHQRDIKLKTS
jgi:hypothetical protein